VEDDWGDDWGGEQPVQKDYSKFDYKNTNLNKLSDQELAAHKKNMDKGFNKNQLKPGDEGFEYDKRIDFSKMAAQHADQDDSWSEGEGEDGEESGAKKGGEEFRDPMDEDEEDMDYFDDDFN